MSPRTFTYDDATDDNAFINACRAGFSPVYVPPGKTGTDSRPTAAGPEGRRRRERERQRIRRLDPDVRERERSYARDHYERNRAKRLAQMQAYQERQSKNRPQPKRKEARDDEDPTDGSTGRRPDGDQDG